MSENASAFTQASAGTLRALASALRSGQLSSVSRMSLSRVAHCPEQLLTELSRLSAEGLASEHMALMLEVAAEVAEQRLSGSVPASLVWSGPESTISESRDTAVVVEELFAHAERLVLVSSYVVQKRTTVFRALAQRMEERPDLHVQLFLHVGRKTARHARRFRASARVRCRTRTALE